MRGVVFDKIKNFCPPGPHEVPFGPPDQLSLARAGDERVTIVPEQRQSDLSPPFSTCGFITAAVNLAMMTAAHNASGNGSLCADGIDCCPKQDATGDDLLEDGHVKAEGAERHGNMTAVPATPDYREGQGHSSIILACLTRVVEHTAAGPANMVSQARRRRRAGCDRWLRLA